ILERPPASPLDDMAEHTGIVAAWSTYLTAVARSRPTILVLDDVHRTDAAFDTLLADCLRPLRALPLLVISTARPDRPERTFQWVTTDSLTLTLHGLEAWETDELLRNLLSDDPVTEAQQAVVRIRSGGNPLYAIHFARMLRQQGWSGSIPDSTRSLIAARLDLLAPLERAMVFAGAVADQPFPVAQLAAMHASTSGPPSPAVQRLVDKALLVGRVPDALAFSHDLVRDVADEQLVRASPASRGGGGMGRRACR
ncbi:MAG TPA: hypothetical protein VKD67_03315, partial [Acidimicrobiales bacterium]|nr:hypothetical protein [Acidimicrobiales bacterium]